MNHFEKSLIGFVKDPTCCFCPRDATQGMFCERHNQIELAMCFADPNWVTSEEVTSLLRFIGDRNVEQLLALTAPLAEGVNPSANRKPAPRVRQLALRVRALDGEEGILLSEVKRQLQKRIEHRLKVEAISDSTGDSGAKEVAAALTSAYERTKA